MARKKKSKWARYEDYLDGKLKLELYQKIGVAMLVVLIAGFFGWLWEFCLTEIFAGFDALYIEGGNLLPWISMYAYGAVLIILATFKLRRYPWAVAVISGILCGVLELVTGMLVYEFGNGTRYWDYSKSWWGIGHINGFVCPASVLAFGLGGLLLVYCLLPVCIRLSQRISKKTFLAAVITLFALVMVDDLISLTFKNMNLPTAMDLYESWGWKYKE